jgi:hypothetical protein
MGKEDFRPFIELKHGFLIEKQKWNHKTTYLPTYRKRHRNQLCGYFADLGAVLVSSKKRSSFQSSKKPQTLFAVSGFLLLR